MIRCETILAIGAHPDDIEYGCFGFLLSKVATAKIHLYVGSLGSVGDATTGPERAQESHRAFTRLSPESITLRERAGIESSDLRSIVDELTNLIQRTNPDLILCLGPHDTHQEHRYIYEATIAAARRSKASILTYGILSNTLDFKPSLFVDISDHYEAKKSALREHVTQAKRFYMGESYLNIFHSHNYASLHGLRFCEAFEVVRIFS